MHSKIYLFIVLLIQNKTAFAIPKQTIKERASTIVVIKGLAITAGSKPIFFAKSGSVQPTTLATITVSAIATDTTIATKKVISGLFNRQQSIINNLIKHLEDVLANRKNSISFVDKSDEDLEKELKNQKMSLVKFLYM